jgi:hypothetical protein
MFEQSFPINSLEKWTPSYVSGTDHPIMEVSNRYFTQKIHSSSNDIVPLEKDIDPRGILKKVAGTEFVHTVENSVSYFKLVEDTDNKQRYVFI